MKTGMRRECADIRAKVEDSADAYGDNPDYADFITGWRCEKIAKGARQFFSDSRVQADVDYLLIGGYREGVTPEMIVVINDIECDIKAAYDPDNLRRDLWIQVKHRVNN